MSLFKNVNVVSLDVVDWEKAVQFYREVLGWPVAFSDEHAGWEEYGEEGAAHVSIQRVPDPQNIPPKRGGTTLVLTVEDAYAVTAELRARGIRCADVINIPGMVSYGAFYDPEGNMVQFASMAPPPAV